MSQAPPSLAPVSPPPKVVLLGGAGRTADRLSAAIQPLGYQVGTVAEGTDCPDIVNTAVVVGLPTEESDNPQTWIAQLGQRTPYEEATLIDFQPLDPAIAVLWGSLDDGVMGGVSTSQVQWQQGLRFVGQVSTANSGGFASIRTRNLEPPLDLGQWQGTVLQVQGDGQRYKWILRDSPGWDSLAYCRSFDTAADSSSQIRTPFRAMVATRRARTMPEATPLNPTQLYSMQLMLSKFEYDGELNPAFQAGAFGLTVRQVGVYRQGAKPLVVLPEGSSEVGAVLTAAGLTGVVPQGSGFEVVGASGHLPPEVTPELVSSILQVVGVAG
ncbi:CIA30 family protein [Leptolyngbya sp. KIOST-1]|uniref:CIA30 family protein n=1 Tax=Leptolyngbya sp. KIOST-1 TaxID=1229172 RepID=UPI00068AFEA5|nr:CIA30 family protein [Leptolyngbya sp. KIOST-1]